MGELAGVMVGVGVDHAADLTQLKFVVDILVVLGLPGGDAIDLAQLGEEVAIRVMVFVQGMDDVVGPACVDVT